MGLSFEEAYRILELPRGSSQDEIRSSYKKLALKWHPDKHGNSLEATQKFQEVSSAYKRLTSTDDADIVMTPADMFDLFAHIFFANGLFGCMHRHDSDCDDELTDDDSVEDEFLGGIANRLRRKYERYEKSTEKRTSGHNLSETEAMRNAEELIQEEEKERKKAEKRRAKKKRNKERKKQKDKDKEKEKETKKDEKENIQDTGGGGESKNNSNNKKSTDKKNNNLSNDTNNSKKNNSKTNGLREKTNNEQNPQASKKEPGQNKNRHDEDSDSHTEEPDWDTSSAFFAHAAGQPVPGQSVSKSGPSSNTSDIISAPAQKQPDCTDNRNGSVPTQGKGDHMDPLVLKSRQVAVRGNEMANAGNYQAAVELFTEAIELDSRDFRFFGNRSYCFDRMGQYEKALQDANLAITLAPDWPKGYFRRGRALAGLKLFSDAESSFSQVLKLDKHCEDAMFELARVRVQQLEEMGFPFAESEAAIQAYGTVQAALEALLAGKVKVTLTVNEEIYMSDGETDSAPSRNRISESTGQCQALWVGNVDPEQVSERHLIQLFSRCANVDNVRLLPKRFCAFVNFVTPEGAATALDKMQGYEIGGQNLLLRYPNNTGAPGTENAPVRKPMAPTSLGNQLSYSQPRLTSTQASKVTGPVNGDECYFWRTSGCAFGDKCKYIHIPEHKAVDLKKVEAKYGGRLRLQNPNTKS